MGDLTPDQEIYRKIGKIMAKIAPPAAAEMIVRGQVFESYTEGFASWTTDAGTEDRYPSMKAYPGREVDEIMDLAEELSRTPVFEAAPFTHFEMRLRPDGGFDARFADIPEEQSLPGLYMRGAADLTAEEAKAFGLSREEWEEKRARAGR